LFLNVILKCGADINSTDSDGWTSLHHSCKSGVVEHVLVLLKNNANFNVFSNHGFYPMHVAALHDNYEIIEILHKQGADLNVRDNDKCTPLMLAANGNNNVVKMLCEYDDDFNKLKHMKNSQNKFSIDLSKK
jgi:ankyrin repeat protein